MSNEPEAMRLTLRGDRPDADPRVAETGARAERYMEGGRCCTEAMILAAIDGFAPAAPRAVAAAAAGLCGGMGTQAATCGVYTGAAVAFGVVRPEEEAKALKGAAAEFQRRLAAEAGGLICGELRERMGPANADGSCCRRLTARGAEILAEMVVADRRGMGDG